MESVDQEIVIDFAQSSKAQDEICTVCANLEYTTAERLPSYSGTSRIYLNPVHAAATIGAIWEELVESSERGCKSCMLIRECGSAYEQPEHRWHTLSFTFHEGRQMYLSLGSADGFNHVHLELFTLPEETCPWSAIGSQIEAVHPGIDAWAWVGDKATIVPFDPLSNGSLSKVRQWIHECTEQHPWCSWSLRRGARSSARSKDSPKRLISVGSDNSEVCLCEFDGDERPVYLALTYCWGRTEKLMSLSSNVSRLKTCVPFAELAKSVQDAIIYTRSLGFEYLWVDSICILQDDPLDWEVEASKMGSVYAQAFLTISATSALDGDAGFLHPRQPAKLIRLMDEGTEKQRIYARRGIPHRIFEWSVPSEMLNRDHFRNTTTLSSRSPEETQDYPLLQRGWTFQERLLSRRILHFTSDEIVWECLGFSSCECGSLDRYVGCGILRDRQVAAGIPNDIELQCGQLSRGEALARRMFVHDVELPLSEKDWERTQDILSPVYEKDPALVLALSGKASCPATELEQSADRWQNLVADYSLRKLTFATDTLPAIAGLARRHGLDRGGGKYLAGLWQNNLSRDLLWKSVDPKHCHRAVEYVAPSWSWASRQGPVDFIASQFFEQDEPLSLYSHSLTAGTETSTLDPYSKVSSGHLELNGPTFYAVMEADSSLERSGIAFLRFSAYEKELLRQHYHHERLGFHADSVEECRALSGGAVYVMGYCARPQRTQSHDGLAIAFVLRRDLHPPWRYHRIGLVDDLPVAFMISLATERWGTIV